MIGNLGFVWINGHYDLTEMSTAYKTVMNDLKNKDKGDLREKMREYIELGIVKQSAGLNEVKDMFKDANYETALYTRLTSKKLTNRQYIARKATKGKRFLEDMYQAEDDFFKIVAYENELSSYSKAMFGKPKNKLTPKELTEVNKVVGEIVKNTYPTYSRVPEAIKLLRRNPIIGNFVSFQAESYRTAYNTVAIATKELKSDNPKIKAIGARRLVGATSYVAAKDTMLTYFAMAAGHGAVGVLGLFDDDDEKELGKAYRNMALTTWSKKGDYIPLQAKKGEYKYIDFSASDPHGGINKVINAMLNSENATEAIGNGFLEIFEPFLDTEITLAAGMGLANNQDAYGRKIWKDTDTPMIKGKKAMEFIWKVVEPGTITTAKRLYKTDDIKGESIAILTGFRPYKGKISDQFGYRLNDKFESWKEETEYFSLVEDYLNDVKDGPTLEEVDKQYEITNENQKDIYKEVLEMYKHSVLLGADEDELEDKMKRYRRMFPKKRIDDILEDDIQDMEKLH